MVKTNWRQTQMVHERVKLTWLLIGIGLLLLFLLVLGLQFAPEIRALFDASRDKQAVLALVRTHGLDAAVVLMGTTILCCMIPGVPTSMVGVFVGVCYGPLFGGLINIFGNAAGNLLAIQLLNRVPLIHKNKTQNHWTKRLSQLKHPQTGLTISYMIPIIPSILVSYTIQQLGLTKKQELAIAFLGALPASLLYAFGGDALFKGNIKVTLILVVIVILFSGLTIFIKKDHKKRVK